MGLFAPWFLAGALAVGVPLYLHLLRKHSRNPQPFSSLMFFEPRQQSSIRHRRLRYLVLLALRMAVLLALALAFANPYVYRSPAAAANSDKLLVLAIDNSFSMRTGTRLEDAKREAMSVLGARNPATRAQVMSFGSQVAMLTQPVVDPAALRGAVQGIAPGDSRGSFGVVAGAMRSISENASTPVELHVFSDMQKTNMPASFSEMALPANVSLILHPVVKDPAPNWAVESVSAPPQVWDPKKARVQAVVAGFNTAAAARTVSLLINGKVVATKDVSVPASGRATVEFETLEVPYGFSRCAVKIDSADTLAADDQYFFSVQRSDPGRVLFIHESNDTRSPLYFGAAMGSAAQSAFVLDSQTVEHASDAILSKYAFVVLSDVGTLPPTLEAGLERYVRAGGNMLIAVGTNGARRGSVPVLGSKISGGKYYSREGDRYSTVGDTDTSFPSAAKADQWSGVKFYYSVAIDPNGSRVVAHLSDQTPLLMEKQLGEGRIVAFASGFDNLTNDFPLHPVFVPFIEQTAGYLSGTQTRAGSILVDSFMQLRTAKESAVSVEIVDPEGHRPLSINQATTAQSYQPTEAGFYELRLANGRQDVVGVNADRRESDLAVMPEDVLALWSGKPNPGTPASNDANIPGAGAADQRKPFSVAWYVLLVLMLAALAESALASRYLTTQREDL